ncbi:MAG: hypothetical protein JNJ59_00850, partial [Deltaproteobacteria bacterium]|nr:hypothetical protein [Deltaproteobacteria bacterium]
ANDVVFLRRLIEGGASKSYGIQVARLAGLPDALLARAREVLENLEAMSVDPDSRPRLARGGKRPATWQLSLFAPKSESDSSPSEPPPVASATPDRLAQDLRQLLAVDPDELTPKAALDLVYKLRAAVQRHDGRPAPSRGGRR